MAQIGNLIVPDELIELFRSVITPINTRRTGSVRASGHIVPRRRVVDLTQRSLLPQIRVLWDALDDADRAAWKAAAAVTKMNGWNLFVQDTCYRIKYGLPGLAMPSNLHQYKVGRVQIGAPASKVTLAQFHPSRYFVSKKMRGPTTIREDVAINEKLVLPLTVGLSYRSQLVAVSADPIARFYAIIYSSYQGRTIETEVGFDFSLSSGWTRQEATSTEIIGVARYYDLWINLDGVRGWLEFDNVLARHTGTNFARDYRCNDVNNSLTKANFMIEKSWEEQFLPPNTEFDSVYPAD